MMMVMWGLNVLRCRADVLLGTRTGWFVARHFKQCALLKSKIYGKLYDDVGLNVLRCRADVLLRDKDWLVCGFAILSSVPC